MSQLLLLLCLLMAATSTQVKAQEAPPLPPGKEVRRFIEGSMPRHMGERFEKLSEEEKAKVRKAMQLVWQKSEVLAAREKLMRANDDFRNTLRNTLQGIDPEVVTILDKIRPDTTHQVTLPLPKPEDPDFAQASMDRIGKELAQLARPEKREAMLMLHTQLLDKPEIQPFVQALKSATVEKRMECFHKLQDEYRRQAQLHFAEARKEREATRGTEPAKSPEEDKKP